MSEQQLRDLVREYLAAEAEETVAKATLRDASGQSRLAARERALAAVTNLQKARIALEDEVTRAA